MEVSGQLHAPAASEVLCASGVGKYFLRGTGSTLRSSGSGTGSTQPREYN
jgi:hypothetical protein